MKQKKPCTISCLTNTGLDYEEKVAIQQGSIFSFLFPTDNARDT